MARPTDYTPEILESAKAYVAECEAKGAMPQVAQMAYLLGISRSTIYEWAKEHAEFSDTVEKCLSMQEFDLIDKGLSGKYNPTIAKLLLSSNHGHREKSDVTTDGKALPTPILGAATKEDVQENTGG